MKLIALGERVVIKRDPSDSKVGRVYIPQTVMEKHPKQFGTVVDIGCDVPWSKDVLKVGDRVVVGKFSGADIDIEDKDKEESFLVVHYTDIYCKLPEEAGKPVCLDEV